jgi:hypothetical protein
MSDTRTTYVPFAVVDYKSQNVLSSYALPITPLLFVPTLDANSGFSVLWSFGDGTTSTTLCASKYWSNPGVYTVNLLVYDCLNRVSVSEFSQNITIVDLIQHTFNFTNLSSNVPYLNLEQSKIHGPWTINAYFPWNQPFCSIEYRCLGTNSSDFFNVEQDKFSHLYETHSLYTAAYNYSLSALQYREIPRIELQNITLLYAKVSAGNLTFCDSLDAGSVFVGLSASTSVYYKDDTVGSTSIQFRYDQKNTAVNGVVSPHLNNLGITLSANIVPNNAASKLSITSNGIDGEKTPISSFAINSTKFYNTDIPFVIKIKDQTNHSLKNFQPIELSAVSIRVLSGSQNVIPSNYYSISSLNDTLIEHNGSIRAKINFPTQSFKLENVQLSASGVFVNDSLSSFNLSGVSSSFDIYPEKYYNIYKINENFNASGMMNDLAFQENIKNNPVLFDDFLAAIFGDSDYDYNSIGVKTYERIANFIINNSDIDTKSIDALASDLIQMGVENVTFDAAILNSPDEMKRLVDLASLSLNVLTGETNKFAENFNTRGYVQKDKFGINLGDDINTTTYQITAGTPIVALEKFSGQYSLLNTYQPLCAGTGNTYMLSSYTSDWGWGLVLPAPFNPSDFEKYYLFFEYTPTIDGTIVGNIIDFDNSKTTIDRLSTNSGYLFGNTGVFNTMFLETLYDSLSLRT